MRARLLFFLFVLFLVPAELSAADPKYLFFDDWVLVLDQDQFTDEVLVEAISPDENDNKKFIGIRCLEKKIVLTFNAESYIDQKNQVVQIRTRIDKNKYRLLVGKIYSNSTQSGWVPTFMFKSIEDQNNFFSQMKKGRIMRLEVSDVHQQRAVLVTSSLKGFTELYERFDSYCK